MINWEPDTSDPRHALAQVSMCPKDSSDLSAELSYPMDRIISAYGLKGLTPRVHWQSH